MLAVAVGALTKSAMALVALAVQAAAVMVHQVALVMQEL
jgi:hypothetical protein